MRLVGLTGSIATGKSTVAQLLVKHGAALIDADLIAREVVAPGEPALAEIAARFPGVVRGGACTRAALQQAWCRHTSWSLRWWPLSSLSQAKAATRPPARWTNALAQTYGLGVRRQT